MQGRACLRWIGLSSLVAGIGVTPLAAQRTVFNPEVSLEQGYTDNVGYNGTDGTSDSVTRLGLLLPVVRTWPTGNFDFSYAPSAERFADTDSLDNEAHRLRFSLRNQPTRRSNLNFDTSFESSQVQGRVASLDGADLVTTARTERDLLRAAFGYGTRISTRWAWNGNLDYADSSYDLIDDFAPGLVDVEDRREYGAGLQISRELSTTTSVGVGYRWQRFDLDLSGEETVHSLSATLQRTLSRVMELRAALGGFTSSGDALAAPGEDDSRSGVQASLGLDRTFRTLRLGLDLSHAPSSGGSLGGTSTDTAFGAALSPTNTGNWSWSTAARLALRDPAIDGEEDVRSVAFEGSVERYFARMLGMRLRAGQVDQSSDDPARDARYYSATLGLVWYPLGRTAIGGGS